eukprot:CAMPEP_0170649500 /NCGR_PEP_ID=MMETSP0224-20130122/45320_1 /TAXON_ID=285029 /ORGANISM="Togula jolla, Strain CCCM 725" /LENGTH=31 /DNA_ID= /DNA_START= /DNA_END= /DNA_ORIENTATION=
MKTLGGDPMTDQERFGAGSAERRAALDAEER